ncbi:MAG: serine/threonine protein kinase [Planctomycetia bacterium]|nr:serine/threonine protein kinase [Planctomycetia bacterium]
MSESDAPTEGTRKNQPRTVPDTVQDAATLAKPATSQPALPGQSATPTQIGRFEVRKLLGEGAFARVYLGFDPELGREVAIKLPKTDSLTPEAREAFLRENRLAAIIHHPNICPIYDVGTDGGVPYIVMRMVPSTLAGLLKRLQGPMPPRNAVAITRKLALGLAAAHAQKVIHRDLKPANVLYDEVNREVLLADFGLARFVDQTTASSAGVPKGTPAYMSPEQALGQAEVIGPLSDVYSLGVMLYEMLTGRIPFTGSLWEVMRDHCETVAPAPSSVREGIDTRLDAICLKAMAKKPTDRYRSAKEFSDALAGYLRASDPLLASEGATIREGESVAKPASAPAAPAASTMATPSDPPSTINVLPTEVTPPMPAFQSTNKKRKRKRAADQPASRSKWLIPLVVLAGLAVLAVGIIIVVSLSNKTDRAPDTAPAQPGTPNSPAEPIQLPDPDKDKWPEKFKDKKPPFKFPPPPK